MQYGHSKLSIFCKKSWKLVQDQLLKAVHTALSMRVLYNIIDLIILYAPLSNLYNECKADRLKSYLKS